MTACSSIIFFLQFAIIGQTYYNSFTEPLGKALLGLAHLRSGGSRMIIDTLIGKMQLLFLGSLVMGWMSLVLLWRFRSRLSIQWRKHLVAVFATSCTLATLLLLGDGLYVLVYGLVHLRFVFVAAGAAAIASAIPIAICVYVMIGIIQVKIAKLYDPVIQLVENDTEPLTDIFDIPNVSVE